MGGFVGAAARLEVAETRSIQGDIAIEARNLDSSTVRVEVECRGHGLTGLAELGFDLRSNSSFQFTSYLENGLSSSDDVLARVVALRPGGSLVSSWWTEPPRGIALDSARKAASLPSSLQAGSAILLAGPRISMGGTSATPANSIRVFVQLEVPGARPAERRSILIFQLGVPPADRAAP